MVFRQVPHLRSTVWHPPTRRTTLLSADSYHDRSSAHLAQYAGNHVSQAFRHGTLSVTIHHVGPHASPFPRSRPGAGRVIGGLFLMVLGASNSNDEGYSDAPRPPKGEA